MQRSAQFMSAFLPGHEMQEGQNKLEAFRLFAYVDQELHFPAGRIEPLGTLVRRALELSHYRRIWALEGVSHYYISNQYTGAVSTKATVSGLLADPDLPDCAMVSMHAGMGTAIAGIVLANLGPAPSKASLREAMERFFDLCRANTRPGWYENAIEPMGLAVRSLYPDLLTPVSEAIGEIDINARRLFWHGVGRSLYFVPMNFITYGGSHERALRSAIDEAPTSQDRQNAVAGLVWAVALVNIRNTAVLKNLLRAADRIRMPEAVKNGIVSALMIWKQMVPEDRTFLPRYSSPVSGGTRDAQLWNELVVAASGRAFEGLFPSLVKEGRIASLFQYRDLD